VSIPVRRAVALIAIAGATGCVPYRQSTPRGPTAPTAASEWPAAYTTAVNEARESRLGLADRALADFAQRFPDSPEAAEVPYWRAVYKLDPANAASTRDAAALLDAYLTGAPNGLHRVEATAFRKLIAALDARSAALAAQSVVPVPRPEDKAQQEELLRLRDELARANAELARIRRRLAPPKQ
jgi:hypothetical protein